MTVFARVTPEDKFRILAQLKKQQIAAMTGDGVNDAPALANAHVGIAMGSGTQIAKEASDIILIGNSFSAIVAAVKEGRAIFNNIRKMLFYLFATSSGEVLTMVGALLLGLPLPIVAVQILWINLVTDTILVIPLGLEPFDKQIMLRPPRDPAAPILDRTIITRMILIAATMAFTTLGVFAYLQSFMPLAYAQTIAFSMLVAMQWANAVNARSEHRSSLSKLRQHNVKFYLGLLLAVGLQILALFGPLQSLLHVVSVQSSHLLVACLASASLILLVGEVHKHVSRRTTT